MRIFAIAIVMVAGVAADAAADWVRWQAPDGTTTRLEVVAEQGKPAVLRVEYGGASRDQALPGAPAGATFSFHGIDDDVVVTAPGDKGAAWRFAWRKGALARTAKASWKTATKRPGWAVDSPAIDPAGAARRLAMLIRFGATLPDIDVFFGDNEVTIREHTRDGAEPSKRTLPGKGVIHRWRNYGYPVVRGPIKLAPEGGACFVVPANAAKAPPAPAVTPETPHLFRMCIDKQLHLESIDLVRSKA